jgi:DNA invertase Pin-like site-specific DNA recombinase
MHYGYARVSTHHQETALQLEALKSAGITTIFQEKASSVGSRPQLRKCLATLKKGDVLVIYKLDRIARSLKDLLAIIDQVEQAGAQIKSLTEPLDTTTPMGAFVLQILGAVAQLERSITRQRSIAGQVSAVKRGVVFGRPKAITADQEQLAQQLLKEGMTRAAVARQLGVNWVVVGRVWEEMHGRKKTGLLPVLSKHL